MFDEMPKILSQELSVRDGKSGLEFKYADGSIGFKAHDSEELIVISKDKTVTTYKKGIETWV
ncbi:MAG: hypothetical protein E7016_03095 [Alphaproteobacteria bacterium]|nr:hypothetical protein [Alphaproteobacteria bacterium]